LDAPAETLELHDAIIRGAGRALVAATILEDDEAVAVRHVLELAAGGDRRRVLLVLDRMQEHVLDRVGDRVDALDEHDEVRARELAQKAGCDERNVVTSLELALELDLALFGPRRQ